MYKKKLYFFCSFTLVISIASSELERSFYQAVLDENLESIQHAISKNVNVNITNLYGITPLHIAVYKKNLEIFLTLLSAGADLNAMEYTAGFTPLHLAIQKKNLKMILILLLAGANTNIKTKTKKIDHKNEFLNKMESEAYELSNRPFRGTSEKIYRTIYITTTLNIMEITPLHLATYLHNIDIITLLLKYDAEINAKELSGFTPLHIAVFKDHESLRLRNLQNKKTSNKYEKAGNLLIKAGADVNSKTNNNLGNMSDCTPLHLTNFQTSLAKKLIEAGAKKDFRYRSQIFNFYCDKILFFLNVTMPILLSVGMIAVMIKEKIDPKWTFRDWCQSSQFFAHTDLLKILFATKS